MARIVFTASADSDVAAILEDLAGTAGARVAVRYDGEFDTLYRRLQRFPDSGSPRPVLGRLVRIGLVSPYVVIREHDAADDAVTILRVVHGRRKITRHMLKISREGT